ncbi:MAG TPA: extracellular solute-binding protein [Chloroflexota bacterium]|nr:extracellular solute-binding protein [Chloroflexota bacterium]
MTMTRRRAATTALVGVFGAAATACNTSGGSGGANQAAAPTTAPSGRAAAGPIWVLDHPLQQPVRKVLEQRVADFEKAFPGSKVEYDGVAEPADNSEKFQILVAAGTMPDVSVTHTAFTQQYSHFSDLAPYLAKDRTIKAEDYFPTIFSAFKVPVNNTPRQIGIPREVHATVMYYAKNAVQAAGLKEPTKDWTHIEFVEWAAKLVEWKSNPQEAKWVIENATGLGGASSGLGTFWQFGAEFFSADGKQCIVDQPVAREALQYLADLIQKYHISPSPVESTASGLTGSQQAKFSTGRFKMYASNQNTAPVGTNAVPFEWDMQIIPQVPGKKRATRMAGNAYGVITAGKNKNPDLAWELVKFFVGEEGSALQVQAGNFMSHKKAVEKWPDTRAPAKNGRAVFEVMESHARLENRPKGWGEAMVPINREWTRVQNGEQSIGEMVTIVKPEAEAILKQQQG